MMPLQMVPSSGKCAIAKQGFIMPPQSVTHVRVSESQARIAIEARRNENASKDTDRIQWYGHER
jgi:hypothetical protein